MSKTSSVSPHVLGEHFSVPLKHRHLSLGILVFLRCISCLLKILKKANTTVPVVNKQVVLLDEEELAKSYTGYSLGWLVKLASNDSNEENFV